MTTNQVGTLHSTNGLGFGLGLRNDRSLRRQRHGRRRRVRLGRRLRHHLSGGSGRPTWCIVLMIQLMPNATDIREKFPTMVYQALVDAPDTHAAGVAAR